MQKGGSFMIVVNIWKLNYDFDKWDIIDKVLIYMEILAIVCFII